MPCKTHTSLSQSVDLSNAQAFGNEQNGSQELAQPKGLQPTNKGSVKRSNADAASADGERASKYAAGTDRRRLATGTSDGSVCSEVQVNGE